MEDAEEGEAGVGAHVAEGDAQGAAQDGEETEEAHPGAVALQPQLGALYLLALDVEVMLYPFQTPEGADPVVEHAAQDVAYGGAEEEGEGLEAGHLQACQEGLAAEGEDTACHEGGDAHARISVG